MAGGVEPLETVAEFESLRTAEEQRLFERLHVLESRPAIVRGGCADWPAAETWTTDPSAPPAGLQREVLADRPVCVLITPTADGAAQCEAHDDGLRHDLPRDPDGAPPARPAVFSGSPSRRESVVLDFSTVLALAHAHTAAGDVGGALDAFLGTGLAYYLSQCPIAVREEDGDAAALPELMADLQIPGYLCRNYSRCNLWIGTAATRTNPHFDASHNLLCVVRGRKRVSLSPPSAAGGYTFSPPWDPGSFNHADGRRPDADGGATVAVEVAVCPGDCLFIPEGWVHTVDSDPATVAINVWWPGVAALVEAQLATQSPGVGLELYLCRCVLALAVNAGREEARALHAGNGTLASDVTDAASFGQLPSHARRSEQLRRMPFERQQAILPAYAAAHPGDWAHLCAGLDPLTADILLDTWERAPAPAAFYTALFDGPLGEDLGGETQRALLAARAVLGQQILPQVLEKIGIGCGRGSSVTDVEST